jgi:hypothetical protein
MSSHASLSRINQADAVNLADAVIARRALLVIAVVRL